MPRPALGAAVIGSVLAAFPGSMAEGWKEKLPVSHAESLSQVGDGKARLPHWPGIRFVFLGCSMGCTEHPTAGSGAKLGAVLSLENTAPANEHVCFLQIKRGECILEILCIFLLATSLLP